MSIATNELKPSGLIILVTEPIRSFLVSASKEPLLSPQTRDLALSIISENNVHYKSLRSIWSAHPQSARPDLICLLSGSELILTSPKPREKSEELKARLKKLGELAERKEYQELVKDITPRKDENEPFSSYKDQLGFGLHVALTMFTGYLLGYAAFRALFGHSPAMSAAGGILGLVCGMLVETLLFIIRTSSHDSRLSSTSTSASKKTHYTSTSTLKKNQ